LRHLRTAAAALCIAGLGFACAACGSSSSSTSTVTGTATVGTAPAGFAWLQPAAAPSGWLSATIPNGATMAYPPHWNRLESDPGTVSAALRSVHGVFLGYLNATPRQGTETLANWAHFRVAHNKEEGDSDIRTIAAATNLPFRNGHGSCVQDSYATETHAHYIEIACLVAGKHATTVIVGAAPPNQWRGQSRLIQRSISAFET
jgi:hypothetical protein